MESKKKLEKDKVRKVVDTLLVLHHDSNTVRLVQGVDPEGKLKEILPHDIA